MSQQIVNKTLKELLPKIVSYQMNPGKEKEQRWRLNGINAKKILSAMAIILPDGENLMTRWANEIHIVGGKLGGADCQWIKDTASQIAVMSKSKVIEISLTFEMELVTNYFDITHGAHAYKGEFGQRAGFITMELPRLYFDFIVAFWLTAKRDPSICFPKTLARITALENEELKVMKLEQLKEAIAGALDKVSKNSELLLEAPLIFLLLTHPVEGPYVLCAVIACLACEKFDLNDDTNIWFDDHCRTIHNPEYKFSDLTYDTQAELETMDQKARVYFEQLRPDADKVVHWFRQLGFARAHVRGELIQLLQETPNNSNRQANSNTPLHDFKAKYEIIYDLLYSAFGLSTSNSRITEMVHAFVREIYDPNMPLETLDMRLNHMIGDEYLMRQERREVAKKQRKEGLAHRNPKHLDRKKTQQMQGKQLLNAAKKYNPDVITSLTQEVREDIKIRNINKAGHTEMEKTLHADILAEFESRRSKKIANGVKVLDLDQLTDEASKAMSAHDENWAKRGDIQLTIITEKIATKTHFNSVKVEGDKFFLEIINVLPYIGESLSPQTSSTRSTLAALKKMKKKGVMDKDGPLGKHLDLVKLIAKGKADNTFSAVLEGKSEDEILQEFVRASESSKNQEIAEQVANKWRRMENIFESVVTEIAPRFAKLMNKEPVEEEEDSDSEDEDEADP
jgi:hypothetical protein